MDALNEEILFVGTAEAEHVEMYLKAIWHIKERDEAIKISTIAKMLNVLEPILSPSSVSVTPALL